MNKLVLLASVATIFGFANLALASDAQPMQGTLIKTIAPEANCPLAITENNIDYCAHLDASSEVVEKLLRDVAGSEVVISGAWVMTNGKEVWEISKVQSVTGSEGTWADVGIYFSK